MKVTVNINGTDRTVEADETKPLLWILREDLGLIGTKFGCGAGLCGACTVHADGSPIRSCQTPLADVGAMKITTIEHIASTEAGRRITASWIKHDVPQCGYCQAGQIMSATALLRDTPAPKDEDIDAAMSGNICRCATYVRIKAAIKDAASAGGAN